MRYVLHVFNKPLDDEPAWERSFQGTPEVVAEALFDTLADAVPEITCLSSSIDAQPWEMERMDARWRELWDQHDAARIERYSTD